MHYFFTVTKKLLEESFITIIKGFSVALEFTTTEENVERLKKGIKEANLRLEKILSSAKNTEGYK